MQSLIESLWTGNSDGPTGEHRQTDQQMLPNALSPCYAINNDWPVYSLYVFLIPD